MIYDFIFSDIHIVVYMRDEPSTRIINPLSRDLLLGGASQSQTTFIDYSNPDIDLDLCISMNDLLQCLCSVCVRIGKVVSRNSATQRPPLRSL